MPMHPRTLRDSWSGKAAPVSRQLPHGRWCDLVCLPDGEARLLVFPDVFSMSPDVIYTFRDLDDALDAFSFWPGDADGEPWGWYSREPDDRLGRG